jgi:NAD/NADP transhydrogenase alpha subunit
VTVAAVKESAPGEKRVAIDPDTTARLTAGGIGVVVESNAGVDAGHTDDAYVAAGARVMSRSETISACDILAVVRSPDDDLIAALHADQVVVGLLDPVVRAKSMSAMADAGVTCMALELLPRTLSRAQSMDALSSQASAAGYRAMIVAANLSARYLPMMITAAGTAKPASVIVLGAGVAGLQAIATAKRLGAIVTGFGTGILLPTLVTWSIARLRYEQRGRGAGLFTGALFFGEFVTPLVILGLTPAVGSLGGAIAVVGGFSVALCIVLALVTRRFPQPDLVTRRAPA